MEWSILDTLYAYAGDASRIENNRGYTIHCPNGTSVVVLWHLSAAATINAEEARLYSNGELNGVSSSNTLLYFVLIYLQDGLWIYTLTMNMLCPPEFLFSDYEGLQTLVVLPDSIGILCFIYEDSPFLVFSHQRTCRWEVHSS